MRKSPQYFDTKLQRGMIFYRIFLCWLVGSSNSLSNVSFQVCPFYSYKHCDKLKKYCGENLLPIKTYLLLLAHRQWWIHCHPVLKCPAVHPKIPSFLRNLWARCNELFCFNLRLFQLSCWRSPIWKKKDHFKMGELGSLSFTFWFWIFVNPGILSLKSSFCYSFFYHLQ